MKESRTWTYSLVAVIASHIILHGVSTMNASLVAAAVILAIIAYLYMYKKHEVLNLIHSVRATVAPAQDTETTSRPA